MFKCGLQSRAADINFQHHFVRLTITGGKQSSKCGRHIIDNRKKQTRTLRISENNFTNDDVMGALQWKLPRAPLLFNPALVIRSASFYNIPLISSLSIFSLQCFGNFTIYLNSNSAKETMRCCESHDEKRRIMEQWK